MNEKRANFDSFFAGYPSPRRAVKFEFPAIPGMMKRVIRILLNMLQPPGGGGVADNSKA